MSNEKNLRNDEEQIDEDDAKIIAALEAAVAEAHNGKPSMTKEERRIRMFKSDLDEAAELLRKAHVTLSAFTASETPQECIIPREAASEFCRSLSQQGVPHLLYEFDPFEPSDYVPETDLTEAMDYIAEHVGCSFFEERIKPAIVCMHFTRESVIEYCEDYNRPKPRDPFWKALRWFEMDLLQYEGEVVKETNNPWYEMPPFKK